MNADKVNSRYLSIASASKYLDVPEGTIRGWIHRGVIPSIKIVGKRLIDKAEIDKFISSLKIDQRA